jgi:hypothetical protein
MRELAQIDERKCKEMKANLLSFVFICFCESGLFNGLWSIQAKKFAVLSEVVLGASKQLQGWWFDDFMFLSFHHADARRDR